MRVIARKPASTARYTMRLDVPVAFDGIIAPAGSLVEVSDAQVAVIIMRSLGMAASPLEVEAGRVLVIRPRAVIEWVDDGMTARQRRKWRPSRPHNRIAPCGSTRLDPDAGILAQIKSRVH